MTGQMSEFKQKQKLVDDFVERNNPYKTPVPLQFDIRGYAEYMKDNNFSGKKFLMRFLKNLSSDFNANEDISMENELIKKLIIAWDPDFTKVTDEERELLEKSDAEMKRGEYIPEEDIWS